MLGSIPHKKIYLYSKTTFSFWDYQICPYLVENSHETLIECLRRLLDASSVRQIVSEAISEGGENSVARYLHDFTQMVYKPQDDAETEVKV